MTTDLDRGRWTGLYQTLLFLGWAVAAFAGGLLTDRLGYSAAFWIGAVVAALGSLPALFWLPETRPLGSNPPSRPEVKAEPSGPGSYPRRTWFRHKGGNKPQSEAPALYRTETAPPWYADRGLWILFILQMISFFVTTGVLAATLALVAQAWLSSSASLLGVATLTGIIMALRTIVSMFTAPLAGTLSDRLGRRWPVILGAMVIGTLGLLLMASGSPHVILTGLALSAVSDGCLRGLVTAFAGDLANPMQRGRVMGALRLNGDLGNTAGPVVAYALLPWTGLSGVYLLCAGLFGVGTLLTPWLRARERCATPTTLAPSIILGPLAV